MRLEEEAMLRLLPAGLAGCGCLDLACGSGRYLCHLRRRHPERLAGLDMSAAMLAQARLPGLAQADLLALPCASESVDLITCGLAVGHLPDLRSVILEMGRVLRPGGLAIYSDLHPAATRAGWKRTFTVDHGPTFRLEQYLHELPDHIRTCRQAGLSVTAVLEPALGHRAPSGRAATLPEVLVLRAVKAGASYP